MSISNKSQYVQGLVDYVLDTKPYHCKISEIIEQYDFYDSFNVNIKDNLFIDIELSSVWEKSYFNDGQRSRFLTPSYNLPRYSLESNQHYYDSTISTTSNFGKANYLLTSYGIDNAYQLRASRGIESVIVNGTESLAEGIDYYVSKGMLSVKLNEASSVVRKWEEPHRSVQSLPKQTWEGSLLVQKDPLNPINVSNIFFKDASPSFDRWTIERNPIVQFDFPVASNVWTVQHNFDSIDVMWQAYIETGIPGVYEAILALQVVVINNNTIEITLGAPHTGKVVVYETIPDQVFVQSTPSTTWTITHNHNSLNVFAQPLIEVAPSTYEYLIPVETKVLDANNVELHFSMPQVGKVFLPNLPFGFTQSTIATTWTIPGNFSGTDLSFFAIYVDDGVGSYVQDYSPDFVVSPVAMTLTFPSAYKGYVSYGYNNSYKVTSRNDGLLGYAKLVTTGSIAVTPTIEQQDFYIAHDPSSVLVNGLNTGFTSITPGHIRLDEPVHDDLTPIVFSHVIDRFENAHIAFDITGGSGLEAYIELREEGFTIYPNAPEETWTLIKVNPISYRQLVHEYIGLPLVQIRALKDIPNPLDPNGFDITLPTFDYLRHRYKIELVSLPNTYLITDLATGSTYTGIGSSFVVSNLFEFTITSSIRQLHVGDYAYFAFGYDTDDYSSPIYNPYDNGLTAVPYFGTITEFHPGRETLKLLPLGQAYSNAVTEVIQLTFSASEKCFYVDGSVSGAHPNAFLGHEYDNGLVRFRLVSSSEVFDITKMVDDPRNYMLGYTERSIAALDLLDGDTFHFEILAERPNYLVHGSITGYTKPAVVGQYYWNGKIGFQLDLPKYQVHEGSALRGVALTGAGTITLSNGNVITFNEPPRLDADDERLNLKFHPEIGQCPLVDDYEQFLVYSSSRGQLQSAVLDEPYEVTFAECAERGAERSNMFNFTIEPGSYAPDYEFSISIIANKFKMCHSQDVLLLPYQVGPINTLRVNTYREDNLTLELRTNHPELGSYSELIPTYLVASDDYNVGRGYDGHILRLGYDVFGHTLTPLNYTSPATTLIQGGQVIFNSFNEINVDPQGNGPYDAIFEFEPYDTTGYGTANDGAYPNKPHKQSPNIPDRAYIYDVFLSNVAYQSEAKHNKVGTITWMADPVDNVFRQVLDVTPHFASNYLKLNTELTIRVEQADEYNDLVRVKMYEQLEFLNIEVESINVNLPDTGVPGTDDGDNWADTKFDDFSLDARSDYEILAYHGYDMYGYDMVDFAINLDTGLPYMLGGYEEDLPDPSNIRVLDILLQLHDTYTDTRIEHPVAELLLQLEDATNVIELYTNAPSVPGIGVRGYLLQEGIDYTTSSVLGQPSYKAITIHRPQPLQLVSY